MVQYDRLSLLTCNDQGEHGIGLGKMESLLLELGPETVHVMRLLKQALDPLWLLNPGKIFEADPNISPKDSYEGATLSAHRAQYDRH